MLKAPYQAVCSLGERRVQDEWASIQDDLFLLLLLFILPLLRRLLGNQCECVCVSLCGNLSLGTNMPAQESLRGNVNVCMGVSEWGSSRLLERVWARSILSLRLARLA